jgi:hypothetical protein
MHKYITADDQSMLFNVLYASFTPVSPSHSVAAVYARDLVHRAHRARVRRREGAVAHRDRGPRRTAALGGAAGGPDALLRERILLARKVTAEDRLFSVASHMYGSV